MDIKERGLKTSIGFLLDQIKWQLIFEGMYVSKRMYVDERLVFMVDFNILDVTQHLPNT